MRSLLVLFVVCFSYSLTKAQGYDKRAKIFVNAGIAKPQGDFKSAGLTMYSGYAEDAFVGKLGLSVPVHSAIDITGSISRATYALDESFRFDFTNSVSTGIIVQSPSSSVKDIRFAAGKYTNTNAFVGFKIAFGNKGRIELNPAIGFSWLTPPNIAYDFIVDKERFNSNTSYETSAVLTFSLAAGAVYPLSDQVGINLNVEYLESTHENDVIVRVEDENGNAYINQATGKIKFSTLNLTAGLVIFINSQNEEVKSSTEEYFK